MTSPPDSLLARVRRFFATSRADLRPLSIELHGRPVTLWECVAPPALDRNGPLQRMGAGRTPHEAWEDALINCA